MDILRTEDAGRKGPVNEVVAAPMLEPARPVPAAWGRIDEEQVTPDIVFDASKKLVEAGLSVIPIEAYEGSKSPDPYRLPRPNDKLTGKPRPSWSAYQIRRPTLDELNQWHDTTGSYGLAVVGGTVSGGKSGFGLEIIDLDNDSLVEPWIEAVERKAPGLVGRLVRVRTPRPGMHCYYRCERYSVSRKLAWAPAVDDAGQTALDPQGRPVCKTLIEVKAEGGYCLIPPSPVRCHPSCRQYRYVDGSADLSAVPTIRVQERTILLDAARSLNQRQEPVLATPMTKARKSASGDLPGEDFNARGTWEDVLADHGWSVSSYHGDEIRWCRPGKDSGVSATTNHGGSDLLRVFTSNASPFEQDKSYSKFSAYAVLNHGGDRTAAAKELGKKGFGKKILKAGKR